MATDNRTYERLLDQIQGDRVSLGYDFQYRNSRNVVVDNQLYAAEDRGWVVLLADGTPKVTDAGRVWLNNRPRRAERAPDQPAFSDADA